MLFHDARRPGPSAREGPKQVYIREADLEQHGYTVGCRRCGLMRPGQPARGIRRTPACRARIEAAMREAGDGRLQRAEQRRDEELARRLEDTAADAPAAAAAPVEIPAPAEMAPAPPAVVQVPIPPLHMPGSMFTANINGQMVQVQVVQ